MKETLLKKANRKHWKNSSVRLVMFLMKSRMQYLTRMKGYEMNYIHLYS